VVHSSNIFTASYPEYQADILKKDVADYVWAVTILLSYDYFTYVRNVCNVKSTQELKPSLVQIVLHNFPDFTRTWKLFGAIMPASEYLELYDGFATTRDATERSRLRRQCKSNVIGHFRQVEKGLLDEPSEESAAAAAVAAAIQTTTTSERVEHEIKKPSPSSS